MKRITLYLTFVLFIFSCKAKPQKITSYEETKDGLEVTLQSATISKNSFDIKIILKNTKDKDMLLLKPAISLNNVTGLLYMGFENNEHNYPNTFFFCDPDTNAVNHVNIKRMELDKDNSILIKKNQNFLFTLKIPLKNVCEEESKFLNTDLIFKIFNNFLSFTISDEVRKTHEEEEKVLIFKGVIEAKNKIKIKKK